MKSITIATVCIILTAVAFVPAGAETVYGNAQLVDKGRVVVNGKVRHFGDFKIHVDEADSGTAACRLIKVNGETVVVVNDAASAGGAEPAAQPGAAPGENTPDKSIRRVRLSDFKTLNPLNNTPNPPLLKIKNASGTNYQIRYGD